MKSSRNSAITRFRLMTLTWLRAPWKNIRWSCRGMDPRTLEHIAKWVDGKVHGMGTATVSRVVTDSRAIRKGEFFVALRGEQFDGHAFLPAVWEAEGRGALGIGGNLRLSGVHQLAGPDP